MTAELPRLPEGVHIPYAQKWPVTLRAGRLSLAPLMRRHLRTWFESRYQNRHWNGPWDATVPPRGKPVEGDYYAWLNRINREGRDGQGLPWALWWDEEFIGQVNVWGMSYGSSMAASIGYWIDQGYAGRGLTPIAVAMACDYLWLSLGQHRIEIPIRPENAPSLRVVEKLGFREEGLRPGYLHINGDWRDHRIFALNSEEVPEGLLNRYFAGRSAAEMGLE